MCVPYLHVSLWFGRRVPHSHPGLVCFLGRRMESSVPEATAVGFLTVPSQPGAVLTLSCKVEIGVEVVLITFSLGHNFCDEERPAIIPFLWLYELLARRIHFSPDVAQDHRFAYLVMWVVEIEGFWVQTWGVWPGWLIVWWKMRKGSCTLQGGPPER